MAVSRGTFSGGNGPVLRRLRPWAAWLLLLGYLPSLTFLGHFPLDVNIPGTSLYLGLPESPASVHNDVASGANIHIHEEHCHANLGSCSDVPSTAGTGFALLGWVVALLGAAALTFPLRKFEWRPASAASPRPPIPPPRFAH